MTKFTIRGLASLLAFLFVAGEAPVSAQTRLKDVTSLQGITSTPVIGYGLVVGLNKTGDKRQTIFSAQTLANMLEQFGISVPGVLMKVENIAAVLVTAELPPFARTGTRIDITASSVGDARSLQGGVLMPTTLRGPDGRTVATAQGALTIGGFGGGGGGNSVVVNHLTVGRVPNGALVHTDAMMTMPTSESIALAIKEPDFTSAEAIARAIDRELGDGSARATDAATVSIKVPERYRTAIPDLVARLEPLPVEIDAPAKVVINERTGTVVLGGAVQIGPAAVAHGSLSVRISTRFNTSQPLPYSRGDTVTTPERDVEVNEGRNQLLLLEPGTTLEAVVRGLNALGASPRDIIAIMQALKAAGALRAELVII